MGGQSKNHCNFTPRNMDKSKFSPVFFDVPKNQIESKLAERAQTISGYRVSLLRGGFVTRQKRVNGKTVLTLRHVVKRP